MSPRQELITEPIDDVVPEDIPKVTSRAAETPEADTTPKLVAQVLSEKQADAPEETPKPTEKAEDPTQREGLPAPTDSDGEAAVVKPAKKGKKNKKKSH